MDRIRQALEQAEKDRAKARSAAGQAAQAATAAHAGVVAPERIDEPASHTTTAADVKFHRTRTVDVPSQVFERHRLVAALPQHDLADSYRMLRTRVLQQMKANGWNSLAITSPATGCGKTLTAINLAISLAREVTNTVLLVDLDLRTPSVHEYFEYQPQAGLSDYLQHDVPVSDILFTPGIDRLVVLPGRESIANSAETLRSPKMVALVDEIVSRYPDRLVICDLPPILATDDALAFAPYVNAMLLVAEAGATKRDDLERSLQVLKGVPLVGTVLNKSQDAPTRGYYGRGG